MKKKDLLKSKLKYLCLIVLSFKLMAQDRQFSLTNGHAQLFNGSVYVFGFSSVEKNAVLRIYKLNQQLKIIDSVIKPLGKTPVDQFLKISSDTLHDYLNIYLQKKEKKIVSIYRFDKTFKMLATIENVDIARLNDISDFENELFYYKNSIYVVKNQRDSSGLQFYLNKYSIKTGSKNFEYDFIWQFPFERKNIRSAHIFYADRKIIFLYVNIHGPKTGQWILSVNALTGKLIKGTKLNEPEDLSSYEFGSFIADSVKHSLTMLGQKFMSSQLKQSENKLSITNAANAWLYLVEIDSLYTVTSRVGFKLPISEPKTTSKKNTSQFVLRINEIKKSNSGKIVFNVDVFKNNDNSLTFLYSNTSSYELKWVDDALALEKNTISANPQIESFYYSTDKLDMNGRLAVDSLKNFEKLFYKNMTLPVLKKYKTNVSGNPLWVLAKSNTKKNIVTYSYLSPVKKIYQVKLIEEISKSESPIFLNWNADHFIIARQRDELSYLLKSYTWLAE